MKLLILSLTLSSLLFAGTGEVKLKDLTYVEGSTDARQTLDLYLPAKGATAPPLVVFAHGGAWISGSKEGYGTNLGVGWAAQGLAVAIINYRLATSSALAHPAAAEDLASALAWLVGNAGKYGYDPKRIFVVGHSAGAHMAASVATNEKLLGKIPKAFQPIGYVGLSGIYDIPNLLKKWPGYRSWFIEKAFGTDEKWEAASPARFKPITKSPWLLIHSKTDELVDDAQTLAFKKHLEGHGVKVKLEQPRGATHFGVIEPSDSILKFISL